jgi:hypothetical protein
MKYQLNDQMKIAEPHRLAEKPVSAPSFASDSPKSAEKKKSKAVQDKKLTRA